MRALTKIFSAVCWAALLGASVLPLRAQNTVCARVVMQIDQQLTLERQGFVASLGITNGLPVSLDNFHVTLNFTDANGNAVAVSTDALPNSNGLFYYRLQTGYSLPGSVAAGTSQTVAYFIVPTVGAAGTSANGTLYLVGATVTYSTNGEAQTVQVVPAPITVQPIPDLQLQYFLPGNVYGDDPLTPGVQEPVLPFAMGVRVTNHSDYATASKVAIQSGQPQITDNARGLLVDFLIISSEVNGLAAQPTLLANFGDVAPRHAAIGSWTMTASLSGQFVNFSAKIAHAANLGGDLTSLIPDSAVSTHRLLGRVVVDLPGRDTIPDFLATDAMTGTVFSVQVYESDNDTVSSPTDFYAPGNSAVSLSALSGGAATLTLSPAGNMVYVQTASPIALDQTVTAIRSDGKRLPVPNAWISKTRNADNSLAYWLNVFDSGKPAGASYALTFSTPLVGNATPVLVVPGPGPFKVQGGHHLTLAVSATDADGTIPALGTGALPDGATFTDDHAGHGTFNWTPSLAQVGVYPVQFRATNGTASASRSLNVEVVSTPVGGFGTWQNKWWPGVTDPAIIGLGANPSGDRISNLLKYALDANPTVPDESALPVVGLTAVGGQRYLTLTYVQRTDDPALVYEVVASNDLTTDLSTWTVQTTVVSTGTPDPVTGMQTVTVRDSVPLETGPAQRYLRLRVTLP